MTLITKIPAAVFVNMLIVAAPRAWPSLEISPPAQLRRLRSIPDGRRQLCSRWGTRRGRSWSAIVEVMPLTSFANLMLLVVY